MNQINFLWVRMSFSLYSLYLSMIFANNLKLKLFVDCVSWKWANCVLHLRVNYNITFCQTIIFKIISNNNGWLVLPPSRIWKPLQQGMAYLCLWMKKIWQNRSDGSKNPLVLLVWWYFQWINQIYFTSWDVISLMWMP
jgi:hypothetical protein